MDFSANNRTKTNKKLVTGAAHFHVGQGGGGRETGDRNGNGLCFLYS